MIPKILSLSALIDNLEKIQQFKIVFTNGCFDLLHIGHVDLLSRCRQLGDILVVAINSDSSIKRLKGSSRPILNEYYRSVLVSSLEVVDYVVVFTQDTPRDLIHLIRPQVLVKGGDWPVDQIIGYNFVRSYGGEVFSLPFNFDISTSKIIESIKVL